MINFIKTLGTRFILSILAILALSVFSNIDKVAAGNLAGAPNVSISDNIVGNTADYTVSFTTSSTGGIGAGGKVNITYPVGFDASTVSLGVCSGNLGSATINRVGQTVQVILGSDSSVGNSDLLSIQLLGIINNTVADANYQLIVETVDNIDQNIDGPNGSQAFALYPRPPAVSISIAPNGPLDLTADGSQTFIATAYDQYDNGWDVTDEVAWSEDDPIGLFTNNIYDAGQTGVWTIYAERNGLTSNNVVVNITHGEISSSFITPADVHLANTDQTQTYTVTAFDADGNSWDATGELTFETSDPKGLFEDNVYYPGGVGSWSIYAINSQTGDTVAVTEITIDGPGEPVSIEITNPISEIETDQIYHFEVKLYDADGNEISIENVEWSMNFITGAGMIDQNGGFVGTKAGTVSVIAKYNNIETVFTFDIKEKVDAGNASGTKFDDQKKEKSTTKKDKKIFALSAQTEKTISPEDNEEKKTDEDGKIKGTEIITVGPEPGENEKTSSGSLVVSIVLALIILGVAYYGYTYFGDPAIAEVDVPIKRETPKSTAKDDTIAKKESEGDIKEIHKEDPNGDDKNKLRW